MLGGRRKCCLEQPSISRHAGRLDFASTGFQADAPDAVPGFGGLVHISARHDSGIALSGQRKSSLIFLCLRGSK